MKDLYKGLFISLYEAKQLNTNQLKIWIMVYVTRLVSGLFVLRQLPHPREKILDNLQSCFCLKHTI